MQSVSDEKTLVFALPCHLYLSINNEQGCPRNIHENLNTKKDFE